MAKRAKKDQVKNPTSPDRVEGVNILTDAKYGVYVEGAEEVIDMYERGEMTREDLYSTIMDLDVVYKSLNSVESTRE